MIKFYICHKKLLTLKDILIITYIFIAKRADKILCKQETKHSKMFLIYSNLFDSDPDASLGPNNADSTGNKYMPYK